MRPSRVLLFVTLVICVVLTACGLPGQNTNPRALAPAPTAASASSRRVMPQIFTNMTPAFGAGRQDRRRP